MQKGGLTDLLLANMKDLVGDVAIVGRLSSSDHKVAKCKIFSGRRKNASRRFCDFLLRVNLVRVKNIFLMILGMAFLVCKHTGETQAHRAPFPHTAFPHVQEHR